MSEVPLHHLYTQLQSEKRPTCGYLNQAEVFPGPGTLPHALVRGGLVFKAYRLSYHSTLGLRVKKKNKMFPGRGTLPHALRVFSCPMSETRAKTRQLNVGKCLGVCGFCRELFNRRVEGFCGELFDIETLTIYKLRSRKFTTQNHLY